MNYESWNEALCRRFFSPGSGPAPVFFFTDDDALSEMHPTGDPVQACSSLAQAVADRLDHSTRDLFRSIRREHRHWATGERVDCPPGLPLLALSVNAATHMHSDGEFRHTNYYVRFRELLDLDGRGMPDGFDQAMHQLWDDLGRWLDIDQQMERGRSTVRTHSHFHNIGYPVSQALFRQSDANRLVRLFDHLGLPPFSAWDPDDHPISKTELRIHYRIWAPTASGLSPGARQLAANEDYQELLEEILWSAVTQWETAELEPGIAITYLALGFSPFPRPSLRFWIQRRTGMPVSIEIDRRAFTAISESWYESDSLPVRDSDLESGVGLRATADGTEYSVEYDPALAIPLREDLLLGEWAEVRRVEPNETHWVLCSEGITDHLEEYLSEHAEPGWSRWGRAPGLDGWFLYRDVEVARTAPVLTYPELWRLRPSSSLSLAFKGGLKITNLGHNVYLTGGAPDLWIPPGTAAAENPSVIVDGQQHAGPGEEGGEFRLRRLSLPPGHHEATVGERSIHFHLVGTSEAIASADAGSLGLTLTTSPEPQLRDWRVHPIAPASENELVVTGGVIRGDMGYAEHRPVSLRTSAAESFVLGSAPNELSRPQEPDEPPWLARTDLLPSRYDYRPGFRAVWSIQRFSTNYWRVDCIRPDVPPNLTDIGDESVAVDWAGLLIANEEDVIAANETLGREYLNAARTIHGDL
ncbi:MAG: hypothetical protein PVG83_03245 [Acidimicrobiia bacterium]